MVRYDMMIQFLGSILTMKCLTAREKLQVNSTGGGTLRFTVMFIKKKFYLVNGSKMAVRVCE